MVEFDVHNLQKIKLGVHITQAVLIFVAWVLEIAVFRGSKSIDGRPGWYFGLCFLCIPALIYLTMTPRFPRTRKFANPYAMAVVDGLWCIFWITAFASQASYNSSGKCEGACKVSKACVGLGVFIWFSWILTFLMSAYGVAYYKREGYLPGASRAPFNAQAIDPDKEAFSTAPHDDEYAPVHNTDDHSDHSDHELPGRHPSSAYSQPGASESGRPNTPLQYGGGGSMNSRYGETPAYGSEAPSYHAPSSVGGYMPPSVHDDTGYTGYSGSAPVNTQGGRVQFPDGRYDNV